MASSEAASPDPDHDEASKTILFGRYEIGRLLGCGAFAKVYHARDLRTGQSVAVKSISKAGVAKSGIVGHVKKEIAVMRRLRHPNIVRLHEVLASRSKVHFVMEYAKGGELFTRIARAGRLPEHACRRYFQQLVAAVGYCHFRGVFHRDLKPENLLLDEHGQLKVSDFGLSAVVDAAADGDSPPPSTRLLQTLCGTPAYVAPEILAKKGYDGAKVDVWSCGVVLFVLGAGYLPFNDPNLMAMYRKIYKGEFRCPRWMSADMKRMIFRLLDTNPETRITIDEITRDPWFAKGFEESKFRPFHIEEPKEEEEDDDDADRSLNAFDIISFSPGIDLSTLFEGAATAGSSRELFTAAGPPERVVERLEEVGKVEGVEVRRKGGKGWKVEMARGRNGDFMATLAVRPLSAEVVVVEVRKLAGDGFWRDRIRPKLADGGLTARRER